MIQHNNDLNLWACWSYSFPSNNLLLNQNWPVGLRQLRVRESPKAAVNKHEQLTWTPKTWVCTIICIVQVGIFGFDHSFQGFPRISFRPVSVVVSSWNKFQTHPQIYFPGKKRSHGKLLLPATRSSHLNLLSMQLLQSPTPVVSNVLWLMNPSISFTQTFPPGCCLVIPRAPNRTRKGPTLYGSFAWRVNPLTNLALNAALTCFSQHPWAGTFATLIPSSNQAWQWLDSENHRNTSDLSLPCWITGEQAKIYSINHE